MRFVESELKLCNSCAELMCVKQQRTCIGKEVRKGNLHTWNGFLDYFDDVIIIIIFVSGQLQSMCEKHLWRQPSRTWNAQTIGEKYACRWTVACPCMEMWQLHVPAWRCDSSMSLHGDVTVACPACRCDSSMSCMEMWQFHVPAWRCYCHVSVWRCDGCTCPLHGLVV